MAFEAHLRSQNLRRLRFASFYMAAVLLVLLIVNLALPSLRWFEHAYVTIASGCYFFWLGMLCRSQRPARWPVAALPLLFGLGMAATAIIFSLDLTPRVGANPAYATLMFVACLAPLWPRPLLLMVLIPAHLVYLATVFGVQHGTIYDLVMVIGGTAAVVLGGLTAILASQAERQSFDAAAAIRRQKDELAAALARVESLLDERRELVALVAHDLQSPLAGIRALLQTVADVPVSDARKLDEIARTCAQMHRAIAGLIAAHATETDVEPELETVAVEALFHRAVAAAAAIAAEKRITVRHAAHECWVRTEAAAIGSVLDNMLSNALKFSPAGSVVCLEAEQRAASVRLCVRDSGPGVAAEDVPLLFRKFARLGARPTGAEPSSGLGLYIVRSQAERIGARVGYAPNPEGGSVFFVDLPMAEKPLRQVTADRYTAVVGVLSRELPA